MIHCQPVVSHQDWFHHVLIGTLHSGRSMHKTSIHDELQLHLGVDNLIWSIDRSVIATKTILDASVYFTNEDTNVAIWFIDYVEISKIVLWAILLSTQSSLLTRFLYVWLYVAHSHHSSAVAAGEWLIDWLMIINHMVDTLMDRQSINVRMKC